MTNTTSAASSGKQSGLQALVEKYSKGSTPDAKSSTEYVKQILDKPDTAAAQVEEQARPEAPAQDPLTVIRAQIDKNRKSLIDIAYEEGQLQASFKEVMTSDAYTPGEKIRYALASQRSKDKINIDVETRRKDALTHLAGKIAVAYNNHHQLSIQQIALAESYMGEVVSEESRLQKKIIDNLRSTSNRLVDVTRGEEEVRGLETEISDFEKTILEYEGQTKAARQEGNLDEAERLVGEWDKVLVLYDAVLKGKLSADTTLSETRIKILDASEAVQSAKGAMAYQRINYQVANGLLDDWHKLEIKYRHLKEDMLPVLTITANLITSATTAANEQNQAKVLGDNIAALSETMVSLADYVGTVTENLLQLPLLSPAKARPLHERVMQDRAQIRRLEDTYIEQTNTIAPYATPTGVIQEHQ